jgi:hypothetical protein
VRAASRYALILNRLSLSISSRSATFLKICAPSGFCIDIFSNLLHHPRELECVLRSVADLVVVEVAVDVQPFFQPGREGARPPCKPLRSVASPVRAVRSVQSHVREIGSYFFGGDRAIEIVDAKRRSVAPQKFVVLCVEPSAVTELEG